jgi:hypothetical protein
MIEIKKESDRKLHQKVYIHCGKKIKLTKHWSFVPEANNVNYILSVNIITFFKKSFLL